MLRPRNPLTRIRLAAGFPRAADAATAVDCSYIHLINVERGHVNPSEALVLRMARAFKVSEKRVRAAVRAAQRAMLKRKLQAVA